MYDIIGDVHGYADELRNLLRHLGYTLVNNAYKHASRKVIFVGDFIDGNALLGKHRETLEMVMSMVEGGSALAVMGNHEFNALAYHTEHQGRPLRSHSEQNKNAHKAFLADYEDESAKQNVLHFFYSLPMWLELDAFRVVHACWDPHTIGWLKKSYPSGHIDAAFLIEANDKDSAAFHAVETILKGPEITLPNAYHYVDPRGKMRTKARVKWWETTRDSLKQIAAVDNFGVSIPDDEPVVERVIKPYGKDEKPCFIGHYWMKGIPAPLQTNIACVDYSVAKGGPLTCYRWNGRKRLTSRQFTSANELRVDPPQ